MIDFLVNAIIWTFALYGFLEIIKNIIHIYSFSKNRSLINSYVVIPVEGEEENIETILRPLIFDILYGNNNYITKILILDLGIQENTKKVIFKLQEDYEFIQMIYTNELNMVVEARGGIFSK